MLQPAPIEDPVHKQKQVGGRRTRCAGRLRLPDRKDLTDRKIAPPDWKWPEERIPSTPPGWGGRLPRRGEIGNIVVAATRSTAALIDFAKLDRAGIFTGPARSH